MLQNTDQEAGEDVDAGDQDARDRIALRESRRAVHGAVELGFRGELFAARPGFCFVDQAGVQVRVDRHLLAGQGIQREARGDFRDADRAMVDDDVLNRDQHQEDDDADDVVAADNEVAERFDDVARGAGAGVAVQQDQPRGGNIQREPEEREQQQCRWEGAELDGLRDVHRDHQHDDGHHDVGGDQEVEQERRQRRDHRDHDREHADGYGHFAECLQRHERRHRLRGGYALRHLLFHLLSYDSPAAHQTINVSEDFGNSPIELGGNLLAYFRRGVKPACERRILDDRHTVFDGLLPDPQSQVVFALRYY